MSHFSSSVLNRILMFPHSCHIVITSPSNLLCYSMIFHQIYYFSARRWRLCISDDDFSQVSTVPAPPCKDEAQANSGGSRIGKLDGDSLSQLGNSDESLTCSINSNPQLDY
ncbi:hypothetical protein ACET3Z_031100 [Daucus carota]